MTTGPGMYPSSPAAAIAISTALLERIGTALAAADETQVDVTSGFRWPGRYLDAVAVTALRVVPGDGTVGTQRRRHMQVQVDVNLVAFRVTADEQVTKDRAFALLDVIDKAVRADPSLDGKALWCFAGELQSDGATAEDGAGDGRVTEIAVTYEAQIIVTN